MTVPDPQTLQLGIGKALRRLRESRSLTRSEVARRMGEGPSFVDEISQWEGGDASPLAPQLWAYLIAVNATFTDFDLEVDPRPASPRLLEIARELDSLGELPD